MAVVVTKKKPFLSNAALAALGEAGAGAVGSIVSILALYPLDTTRTILQVMRLRRGEITERERKVRMPPYDKPMPFLKLLVHIYRTEGWQRLYKGLPSALSGSGLSWALYFAWNELFKRWLKSLKHKKNPSQSLVTIKLTAIEEMLSATVAGILTTVIVNPIWVINTRLKIAAKKAFGKKENSNGKHLQSNGTSNGSSHHLANGSSNGTKEKGGTEVTKMPTATSLTELIRNEGILGWLSGIVPAVVLLINPGIQLAIYGWFRKMIQKARGGKGPKPLEAFVMGAVSKFFAVLLTFPAQTIKLRMQAGLKGEQASHYLKDLRRVKSFSELIEVITSMWTGVGNKMVTSMLHSAVMFTFVELFRAFNRVIGRRRKALAAAH
ncbi:hypothetical protein GUITHDRAFT_116850 [Guillardia theta CCMP2712]|uniref:Uncharacterized protein n=1 Tax=Guillardia theta (strain CCMP2712) TaxID=905079 RepID=L1IM56_GUITC|nr:hypothetical protein GUITHDRAFT_116850 [Guillardia theta CCMP2712]EKX36984.1 hypothetical protein GUITHDRAFT_116850 [Guillardia theta CCMP2712]|eukprot:XP_005823964.1 hypothetical protein GUITHDRAFT_116850 [Guillardia theta CCMP2712]